MLWSDLSTLVSSLRFCLSARALSCSVWAVAGPLESCQAQTAQPARGPEAVPLQLAAEPQMFAYPPQQEQQ